MRNQIPQNLAPDYIDPSSGFRPVRSGPFYLGPDYTPRTVEEYARINIPWEQYNSRMRALDAAGRAAAYQPRTVGGGIIAESLSPEDQRFIATQLTRQNLGRSKIGSKIKKDVLMSKVEGRLSGFDLTNEEREAMRNKIRERIGGDYSSALRFDTSRALAMPGPTKYRFYFPEEKAPTLEYSSGTSGPREQQSAYDKYMAMIRA